MVNAIATLLFSSSYLPGAVILGKVLQKVLKQLNDEGDDYKLVVLLATPLTEFETKQLSETFDEIIDTSIIHSNEKSTQLALLNRPELTPTFSKVNLFKLVQFDKVLYLDSDTLPIDPFSLINDVFQKFGSTLTTSQILASPDSGWPDIFNSGVFLIKPSLETFDRLLEKIHHGTNPSFDGADQGLLNEFFQFDNNGNEWIRLPFLYNVTPSGHYQYQPAYQFFNNDIKLLHFIGPVKPWNDRYDSSGLKTEWWNRYKEFFGDDSDVRKTIHGIVPVYYEPNDVDLGSLSIDDEIEISNEEVYESNRTNYEEANEVLTNPDSFHYFETIEPDANQWHPQFEEPPKDGKPQADSFPDLSHYSSNEWQGSNTNEGESDDHKETTPEFQPTHDDNNDHEQSHDDTPVIQNIWRAPAIFPWELENRQVEPERSFNDDSGSTSVFVNTWEDLPLIKKIKEKQEEEKLKIAQERALKLAQEEEAEYDQIRLVEKKIDEEIDEEEKVTEETIEELEVEVEYEEEEEDAIASV